MFLLLGGTGVGYSVQYHHVDKLPEIIKAHIDPHIDLRLTENKAATLQRVEQEPLVDGLTLAGRLQRLEDVHWQLHKSWNV